MGGKNGNIKYELCYLSLISCENIYKSEINLAQSILY